MCGPVKCFAAARRAKQVFFSLAVAAGSLVCAAAATVISPTGSAYVNILASGEFSSDYAAANLFEHDVTGVAVGMVLETGPGTDWAIVGTGPGYVGFELGQTQQVGSVFYAQRIGGSPSADKIDRLSLWSSTSGPFAATDPGTLPQAILTIDNQQSGVWCEYTLPAPVTGRYFLVKVEQTSGSGGNIGGNEFRLGTALPDTTPPAMVFLYPAMETTVRSLTSVEVGFSENVGGVVAADLLVHRHSNYRT